MLPELLGAGDLWLALGAAPVQRVVSCHLRMEEDTLVLAPFTDTPERVQVPVGRALLLECTTLAAKPLQGLEHLGGTFACQFTAGSRRIEASRARLNGWRLTAGPDGIMETLTVRLEAWTIAEVS